MKKFFTQNFSMAVFWLVMRGVIVVAQASRLQLLRGSLELNARISLNQVLIFSDVA